MNKNKIFFAIIGAILLALIIYAIFVLRGAKQTDENSGWTFTIWMIWNERDWGLKVVEHFKELYPDYSSKNIVVEVFPSYDDYYYSFVSALTSWKTPDVFVLNNNERNSIFSNQVVWLDSSYISSNDFRKKYKWFFSDDLIIPSWEDEFVSWIPVWYESLGIYYNRRYVKNSEIKSLAWLNNVVSELKEKNKSVIPIWIWNWSTVIDSWDIVTQFFMLEDKVDWLEDLVWWNLINGLATYFLYWDRNWENGYDSKFMELTNLWQTSVDMFSKWETFMVVWYPSLIDVIDEKWFSKSFLLASPFPHYHSWEWKTLVNYNYFVINKDSEEMELANVFLSYLSSDIGAENYLDQFRYLLPWLMSLESDRLDEKIHKNFNVVLSDFYNPDYELSSFNKWVKNIYDKNIISILDNSANYESTFWKFRSEILCKEKKIETLENLSTDCEK